MRSAIESLRVAIREYECFWSGKLPKRLSSPSKRRRAYQYKSLCADPTYMHHGFDGLFGPVTREENRPVGPAQHV